MEYLERKITVFEPSYVRPLYVVQNSNMREIRIAITDWDIPSGADVYWQVATETKGELNVADVDGNTIYIRPYTTTFSEAGKGYLQVRVESSGKTLISFAVDVYIQEDKVTNPVEGSNSDVIRVLVEQYVDDATGTLFDDLEAQAQSELASIIATGDAVIESIPSDYTELNTKVTNADNSIDAIVEKMVLVDSENVWNPSKEKSGLIGTNGVEGESSAYVHYREPVPVSPNDVVRFYALDGATFRQENVRFICAYDADKNPVSASGVSGNVNTYTVPEGIYYINPTMYARWTKRMMTINLEADKYIDYFAPYYVAGEDFHSDISMSQTDFDDIYLDYSMVNRLNPSECEIGKMITKANSTSDNQNYFTTGYMRIYPNETIFVYSKVDLAKHGMRTFCAYDINKQPIESLGSNSEVDSVTQSGNMAYIRASILYRASDIAYQPNGNFVVATDSPKYAPQYGNSPTFKAEYIPSASESVHAFLPSEIPVGVGRTIELYNELVCLESNKYHLRYSCSIGVQYGRKFSITGTTVGSYPLTLRIYNDDMNVVWTGTSTVKVSSNAITAEKKVLPIGDSLTNLKPWIGEVESLSNSKIKFIGTRGRSDQTYRCEGRSGFTALEYLENTSYTFDSNYQGNPSVSGNVNPFWNGERFSLSYYNTQQANTVGTADAVMLFLGTNDVASGLYTAEESAKHITDIIDNIRLDNASIPVFVCFTIYRSNQNGYYSSGGQGFTSASGWAFDSDMKIMNFQNALLTALTEKNYTNVYQIPLSICMDREYDFGNVPKPVNPRLTDITVDIPNESVHPQNAGYMQIADVMYSSFVNHLS